MHEVGAPHLVDPQAADERRALYGDDMERLWGEVLPGARGERARAAAAARPSTASRVAYTPGHASHHVSYLHEDERRAFVRRRRGRADPAARA